MPSQAAFTWSSMGTGAMFSPRENSLSSESFCQRIKYRALFEGYYCDIYRLYRRFLEDQILLQTVLFGLFANLPAACFACFLLMVAGFRSFVLALERVVIAVDCHFTPPNAPPSPMMSSLKRPVIFTMPASVMMPGRAAASLRLTALR